MLLQSAFVCPACASMCKINIVATLSQNNVTLILFGAKFEVECVYLFPEITSSFFWLRCVTLLPAVPWRWMSHYPSHAATFCCLHSAGHRTYNRGPLFYLCCFSIANLILPVRLQQTIAGGCFIVQILDSSKHFMQPKPSATLLCLYFMQLRSCFFFYCRKNVST